MNQPPAPLALHVHHIRIDKTRPAASMAAATVILLMRRQRLYTTERMVLAGLAVSFMFTALA
ncbi:hypothetical protein [Ottowia testudinis]|uniref:Uncharacterized protein n=1 Tax=Ottowia testudinis TaxID=2816950 RepID=A0A975H4Q8_9BURK|nr:hypothetical protein [Ottowia testudinis]QTD47119.1 hypothetical protein J1M35_09750 [Ottowia testudinis]